MPAAAINRRDMLLTAVMGLAFASVTGFARIGTAAAQERIKLFKIITTKDEVTIGITESELRAMGAGEDVKVLAQQIVGSGQIVVWQYAVGRDASGGLQMNPLRRVAILKNDTMRIEPTTTPYKITPQKS